MCDFLLICDVCWIRPLLLRVFTLCADPLCCFTQTQLWFYTCRLFYIDSQKDHVWLPQVKDLQEQWRLLHLQDQVLQFQVHGQQSIWGDIQALFRVIQHVLLELYQLVTQHCTCLYLWMIIPRRLSEDRVGDICNACVLLVKRWKKLPNGSKKNWNHVSLLYIMCLSFHDEFLWVDSVIIFLLPQTWYRWWMPELDQASRWLNPKRSRTMMGRRKAN